MKIIEALKKTKELQKKANDLRDLISKHSVISSVENPTYDNQRGKIREWLQSHSDILKEILALRIAIQRTNLETMVSIDIGKKNITKSIAELIHRRRDLAGEELKAWRCLTDRGIKEGVANGPSGNMIEIKINRFYDPEERDNKVALYDSEPGIIDAKLEVINATTDLIE